MMRVFFPLILSAVLFQSGCAVQPPIEQQTLEKQKSDQAEKRSDAFARDLTQ